MTLFYIEKRTSEGPSIISCTKLKSKLKSPVTQKPLTQQYLFCRLTVKVSISVKGQNSEFVFVIKSSGFHSQAEPSTSDSSDKGEI